MGYSSENERQNKVLGDLIKGKTPEKRVMVGYKGDKEPAKHGDIISPLSEVMQEARMPWFCPSCKKTMKKRLDDKFWRLMGHCFDCQIEFEHKMRVKDYSEYETYAKTKVLENQKAQLKDLEQSITDFEKTGGKKSWYNNVGVNTPMLEEDKWEMGEKEFDKTIEEARNFIREKKQLVEEAEQQLTGVK